MKQAQTHEEIKLLIGMCKTGRLFDVQGWISAGKPVNPPPPPPKKTRRKSPLQVAIDCGFHSLVEVLLEAGAAIQEDRYNPLKHAVYERRLDLVQLLVKYGADIHSVDMRSVFESREPQIMEYFIEQGADVETDNPLAFAYCERIQSALGVFKRHENRFASFREQVNIALRHQCWAGNLKWVSLMLWAGADPYSRGPHSPDEDPDPDEDHNALELAALRGHREVFDIKKIGLDPSHPDAHGILRYACHNDTTDLVEDLLKRGFDPNDQENRGSSLINIVLWGMTWNPDLFGEGRTKNIDTERAMDKLAMLHVLAEHGAKWIPKDRKDMNEARGSLLRMRPKYTLEFVKIMSQFEACTRKNVEDLTRTPAIRRLVSDHLPRINNLAKKLPSGMAP
ncbi:MAG: ankyrin repeat domain-containing protein [Thermodesulfobacteriota bacterium]|nr:ankyrin repeat domain-containing protein [Thermodesulfobacteriota bacterium]